ncbi:MAG: hypothetical protein PVH41_08875 [Anaerolineae bacterium]|jgi:hypothetical protein
MNASVTELSVAGLPVNRSLTLACTLSLGVALLMAAASVLGLLYPAQLYPTDALRQSSVPNDVVSLAIGLPILLGSMWLARRGRLLGLLFWPGALLYVVFNAVVYTVGLPPNLGFLLALGQLSLSVYAMILLVAAVDGKAVEQRLVGAVPERLAGGVLAGLGSIYLIRVLVMAVGGIVNQTGITELERALHVADAVTAPAWILGGVLLWRREPLGYVAGTGLLFQASMSFIGLIAVLLLQPLLTGAPFQPVDTVVVTAMGLICFVPFGLFLRGVARRE